MDYSNYTLFEIVKYKIEFMECLEYSMVSNSTEENEIKRHLTYLKNELYNGIYKEITSTLFSSFTSLNRPLISFLKKYKEKKASNLKHKKNLNHFLNYNEKLIDCFETFNYIINAFLEEKTISEKLDSKIINLIDISNNHFKNFLFFNTYTLYLTCINKENKYICHNKKSILRLTSIFNYCNIERKYEEQINVLKENDATVIKAELEKLSNICIQTEKEQYNAVNEMIALINDEIKNKHL